MTVEYIFQFFEHSFSRHIIISLCISLLLLYPSIYLSKKIFTKLLRTAFTTESKQYDILLNDLKLVKKFKWLALDIYIFFWAELFEKAELFPPFALYLKDLVLTIATIVLFTIFSNALINFTVKLKKSISSTIPLNLIGQIFKIILNMFAIILIASYALDFEVKTFFASLGAAAAFISFVYQDTLKALFSGLQLSFQGIIKVGDWVHIAAHNTEGFVEAINITAVKIRNFDRTLTTLPTNMLNNSAIKNMNAFREDGGKRIMRSLSINVDSVKVLSAQEINDIKKLDLCKNLAKIRPEIFESATPLTNLTLFRHFVADYLKNHPEIHAEGFLCTVRQLQSAATGLPLEIYAFSKKVDWTEFENFQADLFDYIIAVLPQFKLKIFQYVESVK